MKTSTQQQLMADAKARGVTGLQCEECGYIHRSLHMIGRPCNVAHWDNDNHDGEACGSWNLREVLAVTGGAA